MTTASLRARWSIPSCSVRPPCTPNWPSTCRGRLRSARDPLRGYGLADLLPTLRGTLATVQSRRRVTRPGDGSGERGSDLGASACESERAHRLGEQLVLGTQEGV